MWGNVYYCLFEGEKSGREQQGQMDPVKELVSHFASDRFYFVVHK